MVLSKPIKKNPPLKSHLSTVRNFLPSGNFLSNLFLNKYVCEEEIVKKLLVDAEEKNKWIKLEKLKKSNLRLAGKQ